MRFVYLILILIICLACSESYTPKPHGYFRIDFPEKKYQNYTKNLSPYIFEISSYAKIEIREEAHNKLNWFNIFYPKYNAKIHISYKKVNDNINVYLEDTRALVYKHTVKADAIGEKNFLSSDKNVYGTIYDIKGNTASSIQFFLTDSTNHFVRGALYFNVKPNQDSLAPVIEYIKQDIVHLIETFEWKKINKK